MAGWSVDRGGNPGAATRSVRTRTRVTAFLLPWLLAVSGCRPPAEAELAATPTAPTPAPQSASLGATPSQDPSPNSGLAYTNVRVANVPWSIHVVTADRTNSTLELHSMHAGGAALGLGTLSRQLTSIAKSTGTPVAAINGDFYQRDRAYAGDPRGLQIMDGEILSAPNGGVALWIDSQGQPQTGPVKPRFEVTWPDGRKSAFGLNSDRRPDALVLYTGSAGSSTHTSGGREFILERAPDGPWLPLSMGQTFQARVRAVRDSGNATLSPDTLVLSAGPALARSLDTVQAGAVLRLQTDSEPSLAGAHTAIGGGPVLVRDGKRQPIRGHSDSYESSSMFERHPRSALGWDRDHFYFVEVDGRQPGLSVGMTLDELATWLARFGCQNAMNLDGGGSATLWYAGQIRNSPCDGHERPIANGLVMLRKPQAPPSPSPSPGPAPSSSGAGQASAAPGAPAEGR